LFSVSALLTLLLVLSGCPANAGGEPESEPALVPQEVPSPGGYPSPLPIPEPIKIDASELAGDVSKVNNALATATAPVVISSKKAAPPIAPTDSTPLTVPANKVLELGSNVELKVIDSIGITKSAVTIAGTLNVGSGAKVDFRTVPAAKTNAIVISGTMTVADGGRFYGPAATSNPDETPQFIYKDAGKVVLQSGSRAYLRVGAADTAQIGPATDASLPADVPVFEWGVGAGSVELIKGLITLKSGTLKLKGIFSPPAARGTPPIQTAVVDQGATLKILSVADGGVTTGPALIVNLSLTVNGALDADGVIVGGANNSSKIIFGSTADLSGSTALTNFFNKDGKVTAPEKLVGKAYTWNSADGGKWVAQ
jgi:hypothetical protein